MNLVRTHNVPTMTLAKNAKTDPKDAKYNKIFIALSRSYHPGGLGFARAAAASCADDACVR